MFMEIPDWSPGIDFLVSLKCFGISALGEPDIEYPGEVHLGMACLPSKACFTKALSDPSKG